jgi:dipeptidyl-peptidase-4
MPEIKFTEVTTSEGITMDVRMVLPVGFDETKTYPVIFHVYGEPWGTVATDTQIGLYSILLAQKGYVVIDLDNRGTPTLKGSDWRKIIYRKIGVINAQDQGLAAKELLKLPYLDQNRVAVWGWSGGGSMTLNLLFKFPEVYQTGIAIAAVSNQLIYDNIYQERYMGLPQENMEDFKAGSPITYAKNLQGNLLVVHGTGDDNVHYQSAEMLINELIKYNKQFQIMPYPNRSHGIYEGAGTSLHLYTLMTNYFLRNTPVNID